MLINEVVFLTFILTVFTFLIIAGTNLASLILISISGLIIFEIASLNTTFLNLVSLLGGCYLIYYGLKFIKTIKDNFAQKSNQNNLNNIQTVQDKSYWKLFYMDCFF